MGLSLHLSFIYKFHFIMATRHHGQYICMESLSPSLVKVSEPLAPEHIMHPDEFSHRQNCTARWDLRLAFSYRHHFRGKGL